MKHRYLSCFRCAFFCLAIVFSVTSVGAMLNENEAAKKINKVKTFIKLYRDFACVNDPENTQSLCIEGVVERGAKLIFKKKVRTIDLIQNDYRKYGVLKIREVSNADILIIGCGNGPFMYAPNSKDTVAEAEMKRFWSKKHLHQNITTIDPDISMNPTILAFWGKQSMRDVLPKNYYKTIIFEGFFPENMSQEDIDFYAREFNYLLTADGRVEFQCSDEGPSENKVIYNFKTGWMKNWQRTIFGR